MRGLLAIALVVALAGCIRDDGPSAEERAARDATTTLLTQVKDGQYADAWASLHPAYQAVIPEEQLVSCGERFPALYVRFDIDDVEQQEYAADEIGPVDAWRVEVTFEANDAFKATSQTGGIIDRAFNFLQDGERWYWFPATGELDSFKEGNCGLPWPGHSPV